MTDKAKRAGPGRPPIFRNRTQVTFQLEKETMEEVKKRAKDTQVTMSQYLRELVTWYINTSAPEDTQE